MLQNDLTTDVLFGPLHSKLSGDFSPFSGLIFGILRYFKSNFSTEAHVPRPCNGQYLKHTHNHITLIVASMDMVVRMPKVLAITRSWYVRFRLKLVLFQISLFQLIFTGLWLLKHLRTGKASSHVLKNTLSRQYKTLKTTFV